MDTRRLKLKWPVTVNSMYRSIRGRNILSKKAREYYSWFLETHPPLDSPISLPVKMALLFHPPKNFRYDVDNYFKNILDCMTKGKILLDDSQVYDLRGVKRGKDPEGKGYVNVIIKKY
jgi:Holliday junction resolvase RusA-like endonuclease